MILLALTLALPWLGNRPLYSAGEVRNALIAREMLESGDWIQPRLNHVRYYEKPPLMYWSMAAAYRCFGITEFASRLPAAVAYVGTVAVVFLIALELLGPAAATPAALVFGTGPAAIHLGRFVSLDTVLSFFMSVSMLGLILATRRGPRAARRSASDRAGPILFWVGAALAGLTKGFIGLLFPLFTAATFAAFIGGRQVFWKLRPGWGASIVAAVFLPWHLMLAWRDPSFVHFYIFNEHIYRFLNIREPIDYAPLSISAFCIAVFMWCFPWSLFWPGALISSFRARALAIPLIWSLSVLGFFALARSRLEYYAQPAYPALAVLVAAFWLDSSRSRHSRFTILAAGLLMTAIGVGVTALAFLWPDAHGSLTALVSSLDGSYREYFQNHPDKGLFFAQQALQLGKPFGIAWLLLGVGTLAALRARRIQPTFYLWVALLATTTYGLHQGLMLIVDDRSQREAAEVVQKYWDEGSSLVVAGTYEDAGGITFYSGLPTKMLDAQDGDLLFGYRHGDAPDLFLTQPQFDALWNSPTRVFVLTQLERLPPNGMTLLEMPRQRLLTNQPLMAARSGSR